jgi:diphthamide biosynthesis protein 7
VSSTATLALFRFSPNEDQPLKHINTMDITTMSGGEITPSPGSETLFLSFGWHPSRADMMAITTSTGQVYLVHLQALEGDWVLKTEPVITHTLETWCVAISPVPTASEQSTGQQTAGESTFRVYSGGDDSALRYKTCTWNDGDLTESLSAVESRSHDAGVTTILPLFAQEDGRELVVTGSYDEHIRLFAVPAFGRPKKLAESGLGGGVWRLKLVDVDRKPNQSYTWRARILASCMHAGARVVELLRTAGDAYQFRVLGRFEEHKSMNYGSDFQTVREDTLHVVSTSFYDKLLCMWELEMK